MSILQSIKERIPGLYPLAKFMDGDGQEIRDASPQELKDFVERIYNAGHNIDYKDNKGRTLLMYCARHEQQAGIETLIKLGADVNAQDKQGHVALMYVKPDDEDTMKCLLENGANPNHQDKGGETVLHRLMRDEEFGGCYTDLQALVVSKGGDLNIQDIHGRTVLYKAVEYRERTLEREERDDYAASYELSKDQEGTIAELIHAGADPTIRDKVGVSAGERYLSQRNNDPAVEALVTSKLEKRSLQESIPEAPAVKRSKGIRL